MAVQQFGLLIEYSKNWTLLLLKSGLQAFKAKQIHWPLALLTFIGGSLLILFKTPSHFPEFCNALLKGFRLADEIKPFVLIKWNDLWHLPMEEVLEKISLNASSTETTFSPTDRKTDLIYSRAHR